MLVLFAMAVSRLFMALFAPLHRRFFPQPQKYTLEELLKAYCATLDPGPCPDFEILIAYRDDQLSPREAEELQEHFSLCEDCTDLYLNWAIPCPHCPTFEELEAYNAETVSDQRHHEIRTHMLSCPACAHFYVDLIRPGITAIEYLSAREEKKRQKEINRFLANRE